MEPATTTIGSGSKGSGDVDRLLAVARALGAERDLDRLLDLILEAAVELLAADRCSLFLVDEETGDLWTRIAHKSGTIRLPKGSGIAGSVALSGEMVNIPDAYADARFNSRNDATSGYRTRSILAVPLATHEGAVLGVLQALNRHDGAPFDLRDEDLARALCAQAAVAIDTARLIRRDQERQRLEHDLELARSIQQNLLPQRAPEVPGWRFTHWQSPCDATGGDYHDYLVGPDGLDVVVGDVSGHGVAAALHMAGARASLRGLHRAGGEPEQLLTGLNAVLAPDLANDAFMTMVLARLESDGGCRYVAAGHEPPLVYRRADDRFDELDSTGLMLGALDDADYEVVRVPPLLAGDLLVLTTDGVLEAVDAAGLEFGLAGLRQVIAAQAQAGAEAVCDALVAAVRDHLGGRPPIDDVTIVIAERVP